MKGKGKRISGQKKIEVKSNSDIFKKLLYWLLLHLVN